MYRFENQSMMQIWESQLLTKQEQWWQQRYVLPSVPLIGKLDHCFTTRRLKVSKRVITVKRQLLLHVFLHKKELFFSNSFAVSRLRSIFAADKTRFENGKQWTDHIQHQEGGKVFIATKFFIAPIRVEGTPWGKGE